MMSTQNASDAAIGMMDAAYFTSRKDILDWINATLDLKLTKIEQTASGAVACQIIEYIYPGSIPLTKVNWEAKNDFEFLHNYKLLQNAFNKHRIQRHVDVDKLVRAKYQDNLEFCQWLKAFFDQAAPANREDYDPVAARNRGRGGKNAAERFQKTASQHGSKLLPVDRPVVCKSTSKKVSTSAASYSSSNRVSHGSPSSKIRVPATQQKENRPTMVGGSGSKFSCDSSELSQIKRENAALLDTNQSLQTRNAELELTLVEMERERDFYFEKLRDIEVLLQQHRDSGQCSDTVNDVLDRVFNILYVSSDTPDGDMSNTAELQQHDQTGDITTNTSVMSLDDKRIYDEEQNPNDESDLLDDLLASEGVAT